MYKNFKLAILTFALLLILPLSVFAHSGRTDANGCHTNRKTGEYHCHNKPTTIATEEARTESRGFANTQARNKTSVSKTTPNTITQQIAHFEKIKVIRVIDGDTISVNLKGKKEVIRLIGINTPETIDPRKPVECFGKEASQKAKDLLSGKSVILESDPSQGERDKYGRLLRYVFLEDGTNFNKLMVLEGYAYEYTYSTPYKYQEEFKQAQKEAEQNKRGLWADNACVADNSTPTIQTTPIPTTTAAVCNCSGNTYNCPDFATQKQAQACYNYCITQGKGDIHKLDRDKDGVVCETLP